MPVPSRSQLQFLAATTLGALIAAAIALLFAPSRDLVGPTPIAPHLDGAFSDDIMITDDAREYLTDPAVPITQRVLERVNRSLTSKGSTDSYATQVQQSWDQVVQTIAAGPTDAMGLRLAARPYFAAWADDYIWLLAYIQALGYEFASLDDQEALKRANKAKLVFLRHDIHLRDVVPAIGVIDVNETFRVPSVSYVHWQYGEIERRSDRKFLYLKKLASTRTHFGLHPSPLPTLIMKDHGSWASYLKWLHSGGVEALQGRIESGGDLIVKEDFRRALRRQFDESAQSFEAAFGPFRTISLHGSEFDNEVERICRLSTQPCAYQQFLVRSVFEFPEFIDIRPQIVNFLVHDGYLAYVTDTQPANKVICRIRELAQGGRSFMLLIHPAQLARGRRPYRDLASAEGRADFCTEASTAETPNSPAIDDD